MFESMSDEELVRFDDTTRSVWPSHDYHSRDKFLDAALSSFHPNGFMREDAIQRLAEWHDGRELRFLLLRVNDWVPQVRDAARNAVVARLTRDYAPHFAKHLGLVTRLQRSRRVDHSGPLRAISQLLSSAPDRLLQAMNEHRGEARRVIFRVLAESRADDAKLFRAMLHVDDPAIRVMAMRMLPVEENRDVFESVFDDPAGSVRAQALMLAADDSRLESALLDRNGAVRDVARHRLRDRGIDFAALYREALQGDRIAAAIAGLSETGTRADAGRVAAFLTHAHPSVRRAAVRAVLALGGEAYVDPVTPLLSDASRGVSSQARRSLMPHGATLHVPTLWAMYESASADHVRRNLLALMTALPKWESITLFVRAGAHEHIARWNEFFNRRPAAPTARQLQALEEALAKSALPEETVTVIRFSMRAFS